MSGAARSASARDSNQANTLGPAPEMLAPSAPWSSAACFTAKNPGINGARRYVSAVAGPRADLLA